MTIIVAFARISFPPPGRAHQSFGAKKQQPANRQQRQPTPFGSLA
jgi:hypothetical protein